MKIVFLDSSTLGEDISLNPLKEAGELITYPFTEESEVVDRCRGADVIITNKVEIKNKHLAALDRLKLICVAATGMNNIDLDACEKKGIPVKNVKGYSTDSVAQLTLGMALSLKTKLSEQASFGAKAWSQSRIFTNLDNPYSELSNSTWGIIGLGEIGKRVANLAKAFGCEVLYYSTSGRNRDNEFQRGSLENILACDIVSVHCPMTEKTVNLINAENMKHLKNDCVLINVARGGIVNERDVVEKFKNSNISLGFDVASVEPIAQDNPLLEIADSRRAILTPHVAWSSKEARSRLVEGIAANIKGFA